MAKREIEVAKGALERAGAELIAAWKAAEAGKVVEATDRLYFESWEALCAVLTPKRYELLRHLHRAPADSIRSLARDLGRDVKRVHEDVMALDELGLLERDPDTGRLSMTVDEISSTIRFARESPSPQPRCFVENPGRKISFLIFGSIPRPLSSTSMIAVPRF